TVAAPAPLPPPAATPVTFAPKKEDDAPVAAAPPRKAPVSRPAPVRVVERPAPIKKPRPVERPAPAPVRAVERPAPAAAAGYRTLFAEPWAVAYVGGRKLGTTPFVRAPLPPGKHVIQLDVEESGTKRNVTVQIASGAERRLALHLEP